MKALTVLVIILFHSISFAAGIETVIDVPKENLQAGESVVFSVYFNNTEETTMQVTVPASIVCCLTANDQSINFKAYSTQSIPKKTMTVCAGCFEKVTYTLILPGILEGAVTMEILEFENAHTMFVVQNDPSVETSKSNKIEPESFENMDSLYELYQPYLKNISAYEPMYFLVGTDPEKSKFQFSFKYRLFNPESPMAQKHSWVKGFHLAYTQTSFWDLKSSSKPFEDTSYKPEIFFLSPNIRIPRSTGFFMKGGLLHESNGRGGEDSRSTNFLYIKPIYIAYDKHTQLGIMLAPKIWAYIANEDENNPDLKYYRGYFDLEAKLGKADGFVLGSHFWWAKKGASIELDFTYPLHRFIFKNLDLYFQAQYVNALAESLLNFRERTEAVRLGFAIVR